ncbi:glycosyltransferase family 4 protein [Vibrio breoganii]
MKKRILLFSKYSKLGASSRMRTINYISYLENNGYEVILRPLFEDDYITTMYQRGGKSKRIAFRAYVKRFMDLRLILRVDLVWIEKELFPYFPPLIEYLLNVINVKYIVDYDDAIFHNYDRSNNRMVRLTLKNKIESVMRNATLVVCGNSYLEARAKVAGSHNIEIIPTVVDIKSYHVVSEGRPLRIGWIGTPSTQKYLLEIRDEIVYLCLKYNCELFVVGGNDLLLDAFSTINVLINDWSEITESELISKIHIGIMPLPDAPFERGKCGYKLIQYMASGKPVVASDVGVNREIISLNNCGFLVNDKQDWITQLSKLIESEKLRTDMGTRGRKTVNDSYCYDVSKPRLLDLINETLSQ